MIVVISGTNRKSSKTAIFAKEYYQLLQKASQEEVKYIDLVDIPVDLFHIDMYSADKQSPALASLQDEYMTAAHKFVFITPEYNGSFPGVVKLFIDACSIRNYKETFSAKKAALVGIASGRAGNLRGMDHLTAILNHVGTSVLPNKLPISSIDSLLDEQNKINQATIDAMQNQIESFLAF